MTIIFSKIFNEFPIIFRSLTSKYEFSTDLNTANAIFDLMS